MNSSPQSPWNRLPPDVIIRVIAYLFRQPGTPQQLLTLSLVSKAWLAVVRQHAACLYLKPLGDLNLPCKAFPCLTELSFTNVDGDILQLSPLASCTMLRRLYIGGKRTFNDSRV